MILGCIVESLLDSLVIYLTTKLTGNDDYVDLLSVTSHATFAFLHSSADTLL
jgi:hypothetical protein